jgi:hypothetical protein
MPQSIFVSVGRTFNAQQEAFVDALETYLRSQGMEPRTIGRNYFRNGQPLRVIADCMMECSGTVVIAFERMHLIHGVDQRGSPRQSDLTDLNVTTVWNHIEAALAYANHRPLLVLAENGLKLEGLLETGYDWWVQSVALEARVLGTAEFTQVFNDWKTSCNQTLKVPEPLPEKELLPDVGTLSIWKLFKSLKLAQVWTVLGALCTILIGVAAAAFWVGTQLARSGNLNH